MKKRMLCAITAADALLIALSRLCPAVSPFIRRCVTRPFTAALSRLSACCPFPVAGVFAVLAFAAALALLCQSTRSPRARRRLAGLLTALLTAYTLLWGVLYGPSVPCDAPPAPVLAAVCQCLIVEAEEALSQCSPEGDASIAERALAVMRAETGATLSPAKWSRAPGLLSALGVAGLYFPFTGEAIVNPEDQRDTLPFTVCHELAHQAGWAREEEANYQAFLACEASGDPLFRYSGCFTMLLYAMRLLHSASPLEWRACLGAMSGRLRERFIQANGLLTYTPTRLRAAQQAVTDVFLRFSGEDAGIAAYQNAVGLLARHWGLSAGETVQNAVLS